MQGRRTERLNSLLREVISEVLRDEVKNPGIGPFVSITKVDVSKDLHHAKVHFSMIGTQEEKEKTLEALNTSAGFIATKASKRVVLRYFPELTFKIDHSAEELEKIDTLLEKIHREQREREPNDDSIKDESSSQ